MTGKEAKELIVKHLSPFMDNNSFKLVNTRSNDVEYKRKTSTGYEEIALDCINYNPVQIVRYAVRKRIDAVEDITKKINEDITLSPPINKDTVTIAFSEATFRGLSTDSYMPEMLNEQDVIKSIEILTKFLKQEAFPFLDKINDLRELDKIINGDDFWNDDWKKPFNLGGNFSIKRLVIAKLANNPNSQNMVKREYDYIDSCLEKQGDVERINRTDLQFPIPFTVEYLNSVEPMY